MMDIRSLQRRVSLQRRRAESLERAGRQTEAMDTYVQGLGMIDEYLSELDIDGDVADEAADPDVASPEDLAELWGIRGGILRRIGRVSEALNSYRRGAEVERLSELASTYNRTNALKLSLVSGEATLAACQPAAISLQDIIE